MTNTSTEELEAFVEIRERQSAAESRERIAIACLQGILSAGNYRLSQCTVDGAIRMADMLIERLDETETI
jgi:hypothetical protein